MFVQKCDQLENLEFIEFCSFSGTLISIEENTLSITDLYDEKPPKHIQLPNLSLKHFLSSNAKFIKVSHRNEVFTVLVDHTIHFYNYNLKGQHLEIPGFSFTLQDKQLIDYFWVGRFTILLIFSDEIKTLLVNSEDNLVSYGSFSSRQDVNWALCWSKNSTPLSNHKQFLGHPFHNILLLGSDDNSLKLFQCTESQITQLKPITLMASRVPKKIVSEPKPVAASLENWIPSLSFSFQPGDGQSTTISKSQERDSYDTLSNFSMVSNYSRSSSSDSKTKVIHKSSVNLLFLYGQIYTSVLVKSKFNYQINLYKVSTKSEPQTLLHVLKLERSGKFFVQAFDSLVLVHHFEDKETLVFDIAFRKISRQTTTMADDSTIEEVQKPYFKYRLCF